MDQPIGNICAQCMEVAEARWPQTPWEELVKKDETRERVKAMVAIRFGKQTPDFIPKTVESKVKISVRWVEVERPMSIPEFKAECKTQHHPIDLGMPVNSRPGRNGTLEECVLVREPGASRLEIATEEAIESTETILAGMDNLEESHADALAEILKRKLMRRFTSGAPTLDELRAKVQEPTKGNRGGASEPVASGAVRAHGGGVQLSGQDWLH